MEIHKHKTKKIMMLGNSYLSIYGLRSELIECLIKNGYEIHTVFPNGPFGVGELKSKEMNCAFYNVHLKRRGKNIFQEIKLGVQYFYYIKKVRPDIILAYTVKPILYGGIISRIFSIPFLPNITGLGEALQNSRFIRYFYKIAIKNAECIFFQNEKDQSFFERNGFKYKQSRLLPGSGVNLEKICVLEYPERTNVKFFYVARVMKAKGIEEFLEAASKMKKLYKDVEFHICGICEEEYIEKLKEYEKKDVIKYHGLVHDIQNYYKKAHCIVMPSYYPEGMSNVLLEAAASGRPIITTNRVGCKEAVDDMVTGYLVKEKDSIDLFEKMRSFYELSFNEKKSMGIKGRRKVEMEFDRNRVVKEYLEIINTIN